MQEIKIIVYCVLVLVFALIIIGILIEKMHLRKDIVNIIEKKKKIKYSDFNLGLDKAIEIIKKY